MTGIYFSMEMNSLTKVILKEIQLEKAAVSIHLRRGDYLKLTATNVIHSVNVLKNEKVKSAEA